MFYKVSKEQLVQLLERQIQLDALESGGVDNWGFCGEAISDYIEEYIEENDLDKSPNELDLYTIANDLLSNFEPIEE